MLVKKGAVKVILREREEEVAREVQTSDEVGGRVGGMCRVEVTSGILDEIYPEISE